MLQKALSGKDEIIRKIGTPIEMSKVMTALDQLMPANMALVDLSLDTEEGTHAPANTLAARAAAEQKSPETRGHFKLHGVSPTDVDLAEFLARLSGKAFFKQVDLMYSHEKVDNAHVMREFEVSFALELTPPTSASTAVATTASAMPPASPTRGRSTNRCAPCKHKLNGASGRSGCSGFRSRR